MKMIGIFSLWRGCRRKDLADRKAVQVRQKDVQQDQIRLELPGLAQCLDAIHGHQEFAVQTFASLNFTNSMKSDSSSTMRIVGTTGTM